VVEADGFAGAARRLGLSPAAVSRAVAALERQLGTRLLTRTTRVLRITDAGARYVEDCRRVLTRLAQADAAVADPRAAPQGCLTLSAPRLLGTRFITGIVGEYLQHYPRASAHCLFPDHALAGMDEGVDVAVRVGAPPDATLKAVPVGQVRRVICASPAYLAQHGVPEQPEDLLQHRVIAAGDPACRTPLGAASPVEWRLLRQGQPEAVRLQPRLRTSSPEAALVSALDGLGLARLMSYQAKEHLDSGALVLVLEAFAPPALPLNLLHREGRYAASRARAFLDLAVQRLRAQPALGDWR
jgi:DNA-binding transcriptional LysR family regulator